MLEAVMKGISDAKIKEKSTNLLFNQTDQTSSIVFGDTCMWWNSVAEDRVRNISQKMIAHRPHG
jgi:hypothetical protein